MVQSLSGKRAAANQAALRRRQGPGAFGFAGKFYDCTSKSLDGDASGQLLSQGTENADSIDQRLISLSPADFAAGHVLASPIEGSACTYQGGAYSIKKVLACELAYGVPVALPVIIFRQIAPGNQAEEAQDAAQDIKWPAPPE